MSQFYICETYDSSDDGACYALVEVTWDLCTRLSKLRAVVARVQAELGDLDTLALWDYSATYLHGVPEEWSEWVEDCLCGIYEWVELPFVVCLDDLDLVRVEVERLHVDKSTAHWTAFIKYAGGREVTTPNFPDLPPLVQLALTAEET